MAKQPSSHMGVGRGRFRKALRAVLLSQHATQELEELVRAELDWTCIYCGVTGETERLQLDHLWPESQGGCLILGNVAPSCPTCNSDRRQTPWQEFLKTSARVKQRRSASEIDQQIETLTGYMDRHDQTAPPTLESMLTTDELQLLADFDLLLSALSDGALAKAGYVKKQAINFEDPTALFDELLEVAQRHQKN